MRLTTLILFLLLLAFMGFTQPILNQRYNLGANNTIFSSVIATDSCYYVAGMQALAQGFVLQEGVFIKYNLDGTIANTSVYYNDTAEYIFWEHPTLIQTVDNNFAQTFAVDPLNGPRHFGFVKLAPTGDTLIFKTYMDIYNDTQDDVVFQPGGFLQDSIDSCYYGTINISKELTALSGVALIKLDPFGNLLWFKKFYATQASYFGYHSESLIKTTANKFIIGGTRYRNGNTNDYKRHHTKLTITDTAGNLLQTKVYPDDLLAIGCHGLTETIDGGFLYAGQNGEFTQNGNSDQYKGRIVKLDSNFTEEWRIERGLPVISSLINFENVLQIHDSSFIAIGTQMDTATGEIGLSAGWALNFDLKGNTKWERFYRKVYADNNTNNFPRHYLYSADITPDSGFVMVGQAVNYETTNPEPYGQLGWLVKTDKHGCLVPGCEQYDGLDIPENKKPEIGLKLYPNPASNELYVYYASGNHNANNQVTLYNLQGQAILNFALATNNTTYMVDVSQLPKGVYVLQVTDEISVLKTEKVVVE
ncbi:MAG: T9SS type A sorting domain-containing protein [Putridiphycobacter sp.]|nr:T9SS type A sorting domain-containing protein [Putridiphycobacter sp.]